MGELELDHRVHVAPRWGTDRDPASQTDGEVLRRVARLMGFELFPWQAHVADVSLEKQDGRYRYRTVCTQVGRQNGKSKLISARIAMEAMKPGHHIAYTAKEYPGSMAPKKSFSQMDQATGSSHQMRVKAAAALRLIWL
jgi:phage terminase large subunit-like protein